MMDPCLGQAEGRHLIILKDPGSSASITPSYPLDFLIKKHYEGT